MIPILLDLHFFKIYTFGVFAAAALLCAFFVLWKHLKLTSYSEETIFDSIFVSLAGGLIISRLIFVAFHFNLFGLNILKIILVNGYPGASLVGFIIGFYCVLILSLTRRGFERGRGLDYTVSPMLVALSLGKIGSFLSGVDVGTKTTLPLAVSYVGYKGMRHITAFYEAILFLFAAYIAQRILFAIRRGNMSPGGAFYWFILSFGSVILLLDKLKQNHLYLRGLTLNVVIGLVFVVIGTVYFIYINRQKISHWIILVITKLKSKKHHVTIFKTRTTGVTEKPQHKKKEA